MYRRYNSNRGPKLVIGGLIAALTLGLGYSCGSKTMTERNRPVNYSNQECQEKLLNSYNYQINGIPFAWGDRFNVMVNGEKVGVIDEKVFSWGAHFDFYAGDMSKKIGHAKSKVLSWGLDAEVFDENENLVGKLDEKVLKWFDFGHTIRIYDLSGKLLAVSDEKAMSWTHTTKLYDNNQTNVLGGTTSKAWWDDFNLKLYQKSETSPETLDRRLLFALIAMENQLDNSSSSSSSRSKSK